MTSNTTYLTDYLRMLAYQIAPIILFIVGFILSLVKWSRCRSASLFCLLGCVIGIVAGIAMPGVYVLVSYMVRNGTDTNMSTSTLYSIANIVWNVLHLATLSLFMVAIFLGRSPKTVSPR